MQTSRTRPDRGAWLEFTVNKESVLPGRTFASETSRCCVNGPESPGSLRELCSAPHRRLSASPHTLPVVGSRRLQVFPIVWLTWWYRDSWCDCLFIPAPLYHGGAEEAAAQLVPVGAGPGSRRFSTARLHLCIRRLCSNPLETDTVKGGALCPSPPSTSPPTPSLPPPRSLTLLPASSSGSRCAQTRSAFRGTRTSMAPCHRDCAIQTPSPISRLP